MTQAAGTTGTLPRVDAATVAALAALLLPLLTMWHEIGGHAAACVLLGGKPTAIGAFYVNCNSPSAVAGVLVALAGVTVNALLSFAAWCWWRRARGDLPRLVAWYVWIAEAMVAAGYLGFSGVSGFGDLGTGAGGSLAGLPMPVAIRIAELVVGILLYIAIVRAGIRALATMLGTGATTRPARRTVAHLFDLVSGISAVLVGLLNPEGLVITIMSAMASSFGGLAGFISIGFAQGATDDPRAFVITRRPALLLAGPAMLAAFALVLGPTLRF